MKIELNKKGQAGLTFIEVTLVIAVLLGLVSVFFIGVTAYKKGSDRATCIKNISTVQKAVRSYANRYEVPVAGTITAGTLIGSGGFLEAMPSCPGSGGSTPYDAPTTIPAIGTPAVVCPNIGELADHKVIVTDRW